MEPVMKCVHWVFSETPVINHSPAAISATPPGIDIQAANNRAAAMPSGAPSTLRRDRPTSTAVLTICTSASVYPLFEAASNPNCKACGAAAQVMRAGHTNGTTFRGGTYTVREVTTDSFFNLERPSLHLVFDLLWTALLSGAGRYKAYGNLDVSMMKDNPPWAARNNFNDRILVSSRIGCFTFNATYSLDYAALCMK